MISYDEGLNNYTNFNCLKSCGHFMGAWQRFLHLNTLCTVLETPHILLFPPFQGVRLSYCFKCALQQYFSMLSKRYSDTFPLDISLFSPVPLHNVLHKTALLICSRLSWNFWVSSQISSGMPPQLLDFATQNLGAAPPIQAGSSKMNLK